jgi:site-specific DNA-cytosine methylase
MSSPTRDEARGEKSAAGNGSLSSPRAFSVLELFCGLGGCAETLRQQVPDRHRIAAAVDINHLALAAYRHNFPHHPVLQRSIQGLSAQALADFGADLWWLSPPCQPFTRRGRRLDDADPRAQPLLHLTDRIAEVRPPYLALENVPGFESSRCRQRLLAVLEDAGYTVRETLLCPSQLGWPNRRQRYYLLASRVSELSDIAGASGPPRPTRSLRSLLELEPMAARDPDLLVGPRLTSSYFHALHRVRGDDPAAVTACFTAAYGRSPVRSGSYLELEPTASSPGTLPPLRRFSPQEVLRLLGFGKSFDLPPDLSLANGWRLVGNSLSVPAVRHVLAAVPACSETPKVSCQDGP